MRDLVFPRGLIVCIVVACVSNLIWIQLNAAPPRSWDDAEYLAESVNTYHALERGDLIEFLRLSSKPARGVHPPMIKLVPIPMYVLFGAGTASALYANTALILVFCAYVFLLARLVTRSDRVAVLAVMVTCSFPLTYGLWRLVMAEFGLAVATVASQYHLLRGTDPGPRRIKHAVLAGAFIGWGLLWKVSFPIFVAAPVCYLLIRNFRRSKDPASGSFAHVLALIVGVAVIIAGPFYVLRMRSLWDFFLFNSTPNPSLQQFSLGPVLSPFTILKYWGAVINVGTSAYLFILFVVLCILQLFRRKMPLPTPQRWFVGSSVLLPLMVLSFHQLKEPRHLFPAFAAFGIIVAAMLHETLAQTTFRMRATVLAALFAFPAYQFALLSFAIPLVPSKDVRLGPFVLLFADHDWLPLRPANTTRWPVAEIVGLIADQSRDIQGRAPRVRVAGHIPFLDGPVLNYESVLQHHGALVYSGLDDRSLHPTWWDFVVVLSGPIRKPFEYREPVLERLLDDRRLPFTAFGRVALPEGREAVLYRADSNAPLSARAIGENLVTAQDRHGEDLFPVSRAEWELPDGRRSVVVASDRTPSEFPYVYVPDMARFLSWEVVTNPHHTCDGAKYAVKVFDQHSRRGPARELSTPLNIVPNREKESMRLAIEAFRGQVVTIQLSLLPASRSSQSCIGWSDLRIVAD